MNTLLIVQAVALSMSVFIILGVWDTIRWAIRKSKKR